MLRPEEPPSRGGTQWGCVLERSSDPCMEGQAEGKETAAWDTGKDNRERTDLSAEGDIEEREGAGWKTRRK